MDTRHLPASEKRTPSLRACCVVGLWSRFDDHQCTVATIVRMTVQPYPRGVLQAISALEDGEQLQGCCEMTGISDVGFYAN